VGFDPTNGNDIGLSHVVVAKGRDYGDVPPLKGLYHGAPSRALGVSVEITRLS
jgi:transglutaminase-like putative cysteine protease